MASKSPAQCLYACLRHICYNVSGVAAIYSSCLSRLPSVSAHHDPIPLRDGDGVTRVGVEAPLEGGAKRFEKRQIVQNAHVRNE